MTRSVTKQSVWNLLQKVSALGQAEHIQSPESGGLCPQEDYYNLKAGIARKTEQYWKRGRAGFAYTSWPRSGEEQAGIWVFPDHAQAVAKRNELLVEGWTIRLVSWEE